MGQKEAIAAALRFEDERLAAVLSADTDWLGRNSSPDFVYVHSTGLVESGAEFCRMLDNGSRRYLSLTPSNRSVRLHGGLAIVVGALDVEVRVGDGQVVAGTRYTGVYDLTGSPVIVSWHSSPRNQ